MRLLALGAAFVILATACSTPAPPAPTPPPATAAPRPTPPPTPQPQGPQQQHADYKAVTQPLLLPLGALIVAVRANTPTTDYWLGQFNKSADSALQAIDGDSSDTATRLRTGIANVRARPTDLQTLEDTRSMLLAI